jgi:hypothetical protein
LRYVFALITAIALVGCSDHKAASEKNFTVAIQSYLDTAYPKCYFVHNFPATDDFDIGGNRPALGALTKVGLLVQKEERKEVRKLFGAGTQVQIKTTYDLTEEGRKYYKVDAAKGLMGNSIGGFCFGKARVKAITQYSEPADMFGQKISRVNYEYTVGDFPAWATTPEVIGAINTLKAEVESSTTPVKKLEAVVLTNNGWVHERLFKK